MILSFGCCMFVFILFHFPIVEARLAYKEEMFDNSSLVIADCLQGLTSSALFISEDLKGNPLASKIIKNMNISIAMEHLNGKRCQEASYILFSSSMQFYTDLLKDSSMEDQLCLIVVWPRVNGNASMQDIFTEVWKHEIYKIIILKVEESLDISIYTFLPYSDHRCEAAGPPELIDTWSSKGKLFLNGTAPTHFKKFPLRNFHGCPIKCIVENHPPEAILTKFKNSTVNLQGGGGVVLSSLMKRYNFTLTVQMVDYYSANVRDKYGYKIFKVSKGDFEIALKRKTSDLAFGVFSYLTHFAPDIDFSEQYLVENYAFYVPCGTKGTPSIWRNYYSEFSYQIWIILGFLILFFSLGFKCITIIFKEGKNSIFTSFWNNILNLFAFHVESPVKMKTFISTLRFCLVLIMFHCTILSVAYKASMKSFLLAPREAGSMDTWEELEKSDMSVTGIPSSFPILKAFGKNDLTLGKITKRFKIKTDGEFSDIVYAVTEKRDTAYFGSESMIMFFNSKTNEDNGKLKQTICQISRKVASSPATPFLLRKGSPFQYFIKRVTSDHVHGGLILNSTFKAEKIKHNFGIKREEKKYSINQLKGVFILWGFGLLLSLFAFTFELLCFYSNKNRVRNFKSRFM